jgi:hypothetical protein
VSDLSRRDAIRLLGAIPVAGAMEWSVPTIERATRMVARLHDDPQPAAYKPKFFTPHEWRTVRVLADIVIPADERSGSATDAKAPEFIDFMLAEGDTSESSRVMRRRFDKDFFHGSDEQRASVLDDIAFPKTAKPAYAPGVAWFTRFRSNVGSAFFSSAMGWKDLQYIGNVFNPGWDGCPPEATTKLGVSYEEYDASLARSRKA